MSPWTCHHTHRTIGVTDGFGVIITSDAVVVVVCVGLLSWLLLHVVVVVVRVVFKIGLMREDLMGSKRDEKINDVFKMVMIST